MEYIHFRCYLLTTSFPTTFPLFSDKIISVMDLFHSSIYRSVLLRIGTTAMWRHVCIAKTWQIEPCSSTERIWQLIAQNTAKMPSSQRKERKVAPRRRRRHHPTNQLLLLRRDQPIPALKPKVTQRRRRELPTRGGTSSLPIISLLPTLIHSFQTTATASSSCME